MDARMFDGYARGILWMGVIVVLVCCAIAIGLEHLVMYVKHHAHFSWR